MIFIFSLYFSKFFHFSTMKCITVLNMQNNNFTFLEKIKTLRRKFERNSFTAINTHMHARVCTYTRRGELLHPLWDTIQININIRLTRQTSFPAVAWLLKWFSSKMGETANLRITTSRWKITWWGTALRMFLEVKMMFNWTNEGLWTKLVRIIELQSWKGSEKSHSSTLPSKTWIPFIIYIGSSIIRITWGNLQKNTDFQDPLGWIELES